MTQFSDWLASFSPQDEPTKKRADLIRKYVAEHSDFPLTFDSILPNIVHIQNNLKDQPDDLQRVVDAFSVLRGQWLAESARDTVSAQRAQSGSTGWSAISQRPGAVLLVFFGLIVGGALLGGIFFGDFIPSIAIAGNARGLITFLFAFCTIAVVILIAIAIFYVNVVDLELRYGKAKDILTILIGVLGTILGFYFGTADRDPTSNPVAIVVPSSASTSPGKIVTLSGAIMGGTAPYSIETQFSNASYAKPVDVKKSTDGQFNLDIPIQDTAAVPSILTVSLRITDSAAHETRWSGSFLLVDSSSLEVNGEVGAKPGEEPNRTPMGPPPSPPPAPPG